MAVIVFVFSNMEVSQEVGGAPRSHPLSQRCFGVGTSSFWEEKCSFIGVSTFSSSLRFKRGFESEPTLHSGINYAVLLLAAGHQFDTSFELRKVGE